MKQPSDWKDWILCGFIVGCVMIGLALWAIMR